MKIRDLRKDELVWEHKIEKVEDIFCPNCGNNSLYCELGEGNCYEFSGGDYCEGPMHYCINCRFSFTMSNAGKMRETEIIIHEAP